MARRTVLVLAICLSARALAQSLDDLQVHGFVTQGFLFSSHNNYLTMKSSSGSLQWNEGAISVSDPVTDNLRVGIQLHMSEMGQIGGPNVVVDWASGDYKFDDYLGLRFGKIKTPEGLFNDSQDVDPLFLWVLLPQAMYPVDNQGFDLSEFGGELYGGVGLGERGGRLQYRGHVGGSNLDADGGYVRQLAELGLTFPSPPGGMTFGGDFRWVTPWQGLTLGSSVLADNLDGTGPEGSVHLPTSIVMSYYGQWDRGKLHVAFEYWRTPLEISITAGSETIRMPVDQRAWYPMVRYELTKKLQVGSYYSHYINKAADPSQPGNYTKDWTVSGRYDFNSYFYAKVEGHFLRGTGLGYYAGTNPGGLAPDSNMLAARVGFSF